MLDKNPLFSNITIPSNTIFNITDYVRHNSKDWVIKNHYHNIYEIVLYNEISGSVDLNGTSESIYKKKLLYLPPYALHGFQLNPGLCSYRVLHISNSLLTNLPQSPLILELEEKDYLAVDSLMTWAIDKNLARDLQSESVKMILSWIREQRNKIKKYNNSMSFTNLLKHINENKNYSITTTEACKLCNMSKSSFNSNFKKYFKTNFHRFLLEKRVDEAICLLNNTDKNCSEISTELGFCDSSHFSRVFKQITGKLPKSFNNK